MNEEAEAETAPWMRPSDLLVFDLDGTLVDSTADLAAAVNHALRSLTLPQLPVAEIARFIGDGVNRLLTRSLAAAAGPPVTGSSLLTEATREFLLFYGQHLLDHTRSMPGAEQLLSACRDKKRAIVTNKPHHLTCVILEGLGLIHRFDFVAGGDTFPERKPDPAPLLRTAEALGIDPQRSSMIGDGSQDIYAGRAAGFFAVGISSARMGRQELIDAGADLVVEDLFELARIVQAS